MTIDEEKGKTPAWRILYETSQSHYDEKNWYSWATHARAPAILQSFYPYIKIFPGVYDTKYNSPINAPFTITRPLYCYNEIEREREKSPISITTLSAVIYPRWLMRHAARLHLWRLKKKSHDWTGLYYISALSLSLQYIYISLRDWPIVQRRAPPCVIRIHILIFSRREKCLRYIRTASALFRRERELGLFSGWLKDAKWSFHARAITYIRSSLQRETSREKKKKAQGCVIRGAEQRSLMKPKRKRVSEDIKKKRERDEVCYIFEGDPVLHIFIVLN